jgi:hypothetical protein
MAQFLGASGNLAEVEPNSLAFRATLRPNDIGTLGSYRLATFTGLTAGIAANAPLFSWRWGDASRVAILRYLRIRAAVVTGFTAAQELAFDAMIARSWTTNDSGGTAIVFTANNAKKRTSMGQSLVTDCRIAAAATLTAGARTLDANPIMAGVAKTLAAAATVQDAVLEETFDATNGQDFPFVFAQNEGFVVRNSILMGAGGTVRWAVQAAWDEMASY